MADLGLTPFGFFGITPYGLGVSILGTLYFTFIGSRLIPDTGYVPEFAKAEKKEFNKKKATIAAVTMTAVLVVIAMSPKAVPMHVAAVIGALVIVGAKCMTVKEAIAAIDWNCMMLVGSLTAISTGVKNMMTVGWTQYKFLDFLKIGIPMLLVTYIVVIAVTPFYLPY